ncbi:MAG: hypothetical protein HP477_12730 [Nitrospira sp.]|nr:hypothetical protein [Nitrospira sp.]
MDALFTKPAGPQASNNRFALGLNPGILLRGLSLWIVFLVGMFLATQVLSLQWGFDYQKGLVRLFHLDRENNIPSWYSSVALGLAALVLVIIAQVEQTRESASARAWWILAALFLYLSMDEAASIHEMLIGVVTPLLKQAGLFAGFLTYSWVVVGIPLVGIVALTFRRFLAALPYDTRWLFIFAGGLFVAGAIGIEMIGAQVESTIGTREAMVYVVVVTLEEGCEMFGIALFLYALLSHLNRHENRRQLSRLIDSEGGLSKSDIEGKHQFPQSLPPSHKTRAA